MPILLSATHALDFLFTSLFLGTVFGTQFILKDEVRSEIKILARILFVTSLAWALLSASDMAESWEPASLWAALGQTTFGHLWCIRILLIATLSLTVPSSGKNPWAKFYVLMACALPLFSSLTGHAAAQRSTLRLTADYLHGLSAGIWTGGLFSLLFWLKSRLVEKVTEPGLIQQVIERFSRVAQASVAVIFVTGLLMTYQGNVDLLHPWRSDYGRLILIKFALFMCVLGTASINQFIHLRNWKKAGEEVVTRYVCREVKLELALIVFVFAIAGLLTRTDFPGAS